MSHSTVLVIGENYEQQLEPFDENVSLPRYVKYTKAELIKHEKENIARYAEGTYAKFLADPVKYKEGVTNPDHVKYLEEEFPKKLEWSDEQIYQDAIKFYDKDEIGEEGEVYSTYNPKSKWDWYQLGGRWSGYFKLKPGATGVLGEHRAKQFDPNTPDLPETVADQAYKKDIDWEGMKAESLVDAEKSWEEFKKGNGWYSVPADISHEDFIKKYSSCATFAVLKDGEWYEQGEMGYWGIVRGEKNQDTWNEEFQKLIDALPDDTLLSVVDVHI